MTAFPSLRPASRNPSGSDFPSSLQSIPAPRISLSPRRSLLPDLSKFSLLAPPGARSNVGHGLVAGTLAAALMGGVDGGVAASDLPTRQAIVVAAHCVAALGAAGFAFGLAVEAMLAAGARVVVAVRMWRWIARGPRGWFARDPGLTTRVALGLVGVALVVAPVFALSVFVTTHAHARGLMAAAIGAGSLAAVLLTPVALLVLAPPLRALFERAGRVASPGALLSALTLGSLVVATRAPAPLSSGVRALEPAMLGVPAGVLTLTALILLGLWLFRRRPIGPVGLACVAGVVAAGVSVSAVALGGSQVVTRAVVAQSALSGVVVSALRRVSDRDGDGVSALFGAEDCDDTNAAVHPGARDVPGNGVDENCSGADARRVEPPGDGHFARDTGVPPGVKPSIVLITIDTLRPDHMGVYGYHRPTTPRIDAFARGAARFDRAYTTSPRTLRSLAAVWTGRYPSHVAWGDDIAFPALSPENVTLAEALSGAGFATAAFISSDYFRQTEGFCQGFGEVRDGRRFKDDSAVTTRDAAAWITAHGDAPFFAWIHLLDPHDPYRDLTAPRDFGGGEVDCYDEEIARADLALAPVFDALAALERGRPVVTILSADHGEGLREHGFPAHGIDLHEEAVRVPLLVRAPGVAPGPRRALTSLVDLHATVLNYAGLAPGGPMESRSLVGALRAPDGADDGRAHVFAEVTPDGIIPHEQKALIAPPWTLFWDVRHDVWELYDTARDPRQRRNLIDARPEVAVAMRDDLLTWAHDAWASRGDALIAAARLPGPPSPARRLDVRFGNVLDLLGFDPPARTVPAGGTLRLNLYYRVRARTLELHTIGLRFTSEDEAPHRVWLDASHFPVLGFYRTTAWNAGEYLRDEVNLRIDPNTRPGAVRAFFSVRATPGGAVVPSLPGSNRTEVDLGVIVITPPEGE